VTSETQKFRHLLVIEDQLGRRTVNLQASTYTIGRHPSNKIVLKSAMVSRQHAVLLRVCDPSTGQYFFRLIDGDLQGKRSVNGITVNGMPCQSRILQHRDLIIFGGEVRARYHCLSNLSDSGFNRYEYYGFPKDFIFRYQQAVKAATAKDVQRVAQQHLAPDTWRTLIVGNGRQLEAQALPHSEFRLF